MASIVLELQKDACSEDIDVATLLRKAILIATKLSIKDIIDWVENELNGYSFNDTIPEYRKIPARLVADNPIRGYIPVEVIPDMAEQLERATIRYPISQLQDIRNEAQNKGKTAVQLALGSEAYHVLKRLYHTDFIFYQQISTNGIGRIIDTVRNKILEWTLTLEKQGIKGEGLTFDREEKEIAQKNIQIYVNLINQQKGSINFQQGTTNSNQIDSKQ